MNKIRSVQVDAMNDAFLRNWLHAVFTTFPSLAAGGAAAVSEQVIAFLRRPWGQNTEDDLTLLQALRGQTSRIPRVKLNRGFVEVITARSRTKIRVRETSSSNRLTIDFGHRGSRERGFALLKEVADDCFHAFDQNGSDLGEMTPLQAISAPRGVWCLRRSITAGRVEIFL